MSRSNPTERSASTNPALHFFEWNGESGSLKYYDKAKKENILVPVPFTFILLDELATVTGWNDASASGIYSNEIKDTRGDVLVVKAFKGGVIAEGFYSQIKDKIGAAGGSFTASIYVATKSADGGLELNNVKFKGAALNAWIEFRKIAGDDIYKKAVRIVGFGEGKKGKVVFRFPTFAIASISPETEQMAVAVDKELQAHLAGYFGKTKLAQASAAPAGEDEEPHVDHSPTAPEATDIDVLADEDLPF